jgi:hypothetical protein
MDLLFENQTKSLVVQILFMKTREWLSAICVKCFGYCLTNIISSRHYDYDIINRQINIHLEIKSLVSNDAIMVWVRRSSIQPEMLRCPMLISIEGHSVADFHTQSVFNTWWHYKQIYFYFIIIK